MLMLQTKLEGKKACFGVIRERIDKLGFTVGGNWDYDRGCFDSILWREGGETIYLRIPFVVTDGELDNYNASILFQAPYVIKHVVNIGLDKDENSLLSATGLNQFQEPLDKDGYIRNKNQWADLGEQAVLKVFKYMERTLIF